MSAVVAVFGLIGAQCLVITASAHAAIPNLRPAPLPRDIAASVTGAVSIKATPSGQGFLLLSPSGTVTSYGDAPSGGVAHLPHRAVALAVTKTGKGYWVFDTNGCSAAFGDATPFAQSVCGTVLNADVIDAATTPDGRGYWLVASDGGIFSFGDAPFLGSMGGRHLNAPIVGMAQTPTGTGYWEVAADGGIFAFNAPFLGSRGGLPLNQPIVAMVASGRGYMMVARDGGIFNFGNPFYGSDSGTNAPIIAAAPSTDQSGNPNGYWTLSSPGDIIAFGFAWLPTDPAPPPGQTCSVTTTDPTPAPGTDEIVNITSTAPNTTGEMQLGDPVIYNQAFTTDASGNGQTSFGIGSPPHGLQTDIIIYVGSAMCATHVTAA